MKNFILKIQISLLLFCISLTVDAQKTIGYVTYWSGSASDIQYSKLTNIIYSFAIPKTDGHLKPLEGIAKLQQVVTSAHAVGCKVSIAIGGWSENGVELDSRFEAIGANATYRTNLVNDAVALVNQYNLDGVDMDWEFPDAGSSANNFEDLMTEMYNALHQHGKLVTAAVSGGAVNGVGINLNVKNVVDWLNVMCYDYNNYQHSTYADAVAGVQYYIDKGFPASKVAMGVPFYGRDGSQAYLTENYSALVGRGADKNADTYSGVGYNGITTIKQKADYAKTNGLAGIMIWELSQDLNDANSLLSAIHDVFSIPANVAPTAAVTSPLSGSKILFGTTISITARATDNDGNITKVEFFDGDIKIGEASGNTYVFNWNGATLGLHSIKVKATDNKGSVTTSPVSSINVVENAAPKVVLLSPARESKLIESSTITLLAGASDPDGDATIKKVEFFDGITKIGEDLGAPFSLAWKGSVGGHSIILKVTDDMGSQVTSESYPISYNTYFSCSVLPTYSSTRTYYLGDQVQYLGKSWGAKTKTSSVPSELNFSYWGLICDCNTSAKAPVTAITAPSNGVTKNIGESFTITASASDPDDKVMKVVFYSNGVYIGQDNTSPYNCNWTSETPGTFGIVSKAIDGFGFTKTSSVVYVKINSLIPLIPLNSPPVVNLTSPINGTILIAPATITMTATASDFNGDISKVDFYNGNTFLFSDDSPPFSYSLVGATAGTYTISAKAYDNMNATSTSNAVSVTVSAGTIGSCSGTATYVEAGGYVPGSRVQNVGNIYECRPFPNSGWCNQAAYAYAPGTGTAWGEAWLLVGPCTSSRLNMSTSTTEVGQDKVSSTVYPNPFENSFTINFYNSNETYQIIIFNDKGQLIEEATANNQSIYVTGSILSSGVYFLRIKGKTEQSTFKLVKL